MLSYTNVNKVIYRSASAACSVFLFVYLHLILLPRGLCEDVIVGYSDVGITKPEKNATIAC